MTWECAPEEYRKAFYARPDEYVRFRYVNSPYCFELESAKNLCAELKAINKPIVSARFEVHGGSFLASEGYRLTAVEDRPLVHVGGWASSGSNGPGTCPMTEAIQSLK